MSGIKDCCKREENLVIRAEDQDAEQPNEIVRRCQVCKCRHFEMTVDPADIDLRGARV